MKTFISWSGERSKYIAESLSSWLEQVLQSLEPWISTDIDKGKRWSKEIANELKESKVAIICLTEENLNSNWVHFEAGAIAKNEDAFVCTFLFDITPANVQSPLSQFQHTSFNKEDIFKLLKTINGIVSETGGKNLRESSLKSVFDTNWEQLEKRLSKTPKSSSEEKDIRSDRELLEESLQILRGIRGGIPSKSIDNDEVDKIIDYWINEYAEEKGIECTELDLTGHENSIREYLRNIPEITALVGEGTYFKRKIVQRMAELQPF
ncbi:TIR domain-containing protein [Marinifilum sp. N1E240]|uniref:toll/interleukin-1 receptor domain-containing protein n=1 Tax=Marinifilum sp. N1E240 TaxID=2608082 RepID=UPI00128D40EF|nr:toll/interleukin-1 receptor domain-containing protein [Marinifilum sp. N1E240]MPQ46888.1 TIR domain-containing protein [Marinifilum sp. N1E240]